MPLLRRTVRGRRGAERWHRSLVARPGRAVPQRDGCRVLGLLDVANLCGADAVNARDLHRHNVHYLLEALCFVRSEPKLAQFGIAILSAMLAREPALMNLADDVRRSSINFGIDCDVFEAVLLLVENGAICLLLDYLNEAKYIINSPFRRRHAEADAEGVVTPSGPDGADEAQHRTHGADAEDIPTEL